MSCLEFQYHLPQGVDEEAAEVEDKTEGKKKKKKHSSKKEGKEEGVNVEPSLIDIAEGDEPPPTTSDAVTAELPKKKSPAREANKESE